MTGEPPLLPAGTRLVHVGPHKTGTTALQFAFHEARDALAEQGVVYAGSTSQVYLPALGLTGRSGRIGGPRGTEEDWLGLVEECRAAGDRRVVMSSESFANADPEHIERLARDLGPDRVHVVRMVRRYDKMIPSQWQQQVSAGGRRTYAAYVEGLLADPGHAFWRRHGFVPLTRRWSDVVGADRTTVVVVNEDDRGWLLRVMEAMTGLRPGALQPSTERENRSLTWAEVETLRVLNEERKVRGWVDRSHFEYVRRGVSVALRTLPADPEGGRITLPESAHEAVVAATERDLAALDRLGVRVVGDPAWLHPAPPPPDVATEVPSIALDSVAAGVAAVVARARETGGFPLGGPSGPAPRRGLAALLRRSRPVRHPLLDAVRRRADDWSEDEVRRYLDDGLAPWLRDRAVPTGDRLEPGLAAGVLAETIALTDPSRSAVSGRGPRP